MSTTESLQSATVSTKANVYFDGKCVSHNLTLADGSKKSVGVILPSTLTFNTGAPETMEGAGRQLRVPARGQQRMGGLGRRPEVQRAGQLQLPDPRQRRALQLHLPLRLNRNPAHVIHHPPERSRRPEGRHRLFRRPRHQRRAALDAQQGRDPLRLHRQPRPARRARLRRDPAQGDAVRRREGAPDRLPHAAGRTKASPRCRPAPSTSPRPA